MGLPMARSALRRGWSVSGFDVAPDRLAAAAGAGIRPLAACSEAADAELVVVMVRTLPQVEAALLGESGVATAGRRLDVVVMSTVDPSGMTALAERATKLGMSLLDAPVSGGVRGAEAGTLSMMCSGDPALLARARPLLECFGSSIHVLGERPGLGQAAKLVNQLMMTVALAGTAEGLALAASYGLEPEKVREAVGAGTGSSWVLEHWDWMTSLWQEYVPGNALDVLCKDMRALLRESETRWHGLPLAAVAFQRLLALWQPHTTVRPSPPTAEPVTPRHRPPDNRPHADT